MTATKALSASRAPRIPAHAVNWLDTLHNFNDALPLRQKWHKLKPLLPAENLEAPEGQGVYLVFALVDNKFLTAVHAGFGHFETGLKGRLQSLAQVYQCGAQGGDYSKEDGNFFFYALGTQDVKLLYSCSSMVAVDGPQGYEARLLWHFDFFGNSKMNGGFGVEGARLGAPPTSDYAAEGKRWCEAFMKSIQGHVARPELCKACEEQMKFPVAAPEGEAAAVIAKIQRRAARLLQQAEDLQLACDSARQLTGFPGVSLKQQLLSFNEIADDRQAQTEAALDTICRSIEQLLESGSSGCDYRQLEEAALHNKVAIQELVDQLQAVAGRPRRLSLSIPKAIDTSPMPASPMPASPLPASPAAGRRSVEIPRGQLPTTPTSAGHRSSIDMSGAPRRGSIDMSGAARRGSIDMSGAPRRGSIDMSQAPRRESMDAGRPPSATLTSNLFAQATLPPAAMAAPSRRASVIGTSAADRFAGRLAWEADCWRLYCSVSEAARTGDVKAFDFTVSADQLVQAYDMNTYQGSTLRSRLDKAMAGGSSEDRTKLCCYLGTMRAMATQHEQVLQKLLELEAFDGKKAYTILGHLAIFTDALKLGNKTYYQAAADCLLAELRRNASAKSSPLAALFSRCKVAAAQGDPYPAHAINAKG